MMKKNKKKIVTIKVKKKTKNKTKKNPLKTNFKGKNITVARTGVEPVTSGL